MAPRPAATGEGDGPPWGNVGRRIGKRREIVVQRVLGVGSMGAVWLARDEGKDRDVAVKFLRKEASAHPTVRERFVREGRRFGQLRHDNLVRVYQLGEDGGELYIVAEYVSGRDLYEILLDDGPFDVKDALAICRDVARALHVAHQSNVIHRDLKPPNVMIREGDGRVKVLDFGIAKDLDSDTALTRVGTFLGTPAYCAPEQITGDELTPRTDVFALGVILYELVAGPVDFEGRHSTEILHCTLRQERVPLGRVFELVTRPVARLIQRMTRKIPTRRPASMAEVADECDRLLAVLDEQCARDDHSAVTTEIKSIFQP